AVGGAVVVTVYLIGYQGWFGGLGYLPMLFQGQLRDFFLLFVGSLALLALSWISGLLVRSRRQGRDAAEREEEARHDAEIAEYRVVVEQERNRIARDMHDVVAHTLAVVIAQADGARFAASTRPELAVDALDTIAGVARDALGDVRMLLAELRHDEGSAPQPGVADFDLLFGQLRAAGLDLRVTEEGERLPFGAAREMAAYRIVQEGLTNALRHGAPGEPVEVELMWAADALHIELVNKLPAPLPPATAQVPTAGALPAPGHGLPGMHERAQLAGGSLIARPDGAGRFVVRAWIPNGAAA
ncbi:MAG: histidine kinase, partial [Microbacteriaceae bacterium]|nr:histidine kinase [Microbacteriaceae bacterium]